MSMEQKQERAIEIFTAPQFGPDDPATYSESRTTEPERQ
jgi:hypothetical protein